jgi:hypothetical protein
VRVARTAAVSLALGLTFAACGTNAGNDVSYPACNGLSPAGLAAESTPKGMCPTNPTTLTGMAATGAICGSAADCKPTCCQCTSGSYALVAQCQNGNCLDANDTCCLYTQQCGD